MFVRPKSQVFLNIAVSPSPPTRRHSHHYSSEGFHRRNQSLLERSRTPAVPWEKYRKSPEELKMIKSKKVRTFYEHQVASL